MHVACKETPVGKPHAMPSCLAKRRTQANATAVGWVFTTCIDHQAHVYPIRGIVALREHKRIAPREVLDLK